MKYCIWSLLLVFSIGSYAQLSDTSRSPVNFSGSVGISTNGFSIIPTFSLNSAAFIINLSLRKKRFSFEPDIRLVPDATKGSMLWWLRYRVVDGKKFSLRMGVHPAFTLIRKEEAGNGTTKEFTEMLRFLAFEVVPGYRFNDRFELSAMYLEGHGLQRTGPQQTRVLFLNAGIKSLHIGQKLRWSVFPSVFFLHTDGNSGEYFTVTNVLSHAQWPISVQSTINQTFRSTIPNNKQFMWNLTLQYNFKKVYRRVD